MPRKAGASSKAWKLIDFAASKTAGVAFNTLQFFNLDPITQALRGHRKSAFPLPLGSRQPAIAASPPGYDRCASHFLAAVCIAATVSYWL